MILEKYTLEGSSLSFYANKVRNLSKLEAGELIDDELNNEITIHVITGGESLPIESEDYLTDQTGHFWRVYHVEKKGVYVEIKARERVIKTRRIGR